MALRDPTDRNLLRLEARRFASRCDTQVALIQRADTLREVSRLANMSLPYSLTEDRMAHDARRLALNAAEDRARELISEQIAIFLKAEPVAHDKLKRGMVDTWANLTGPLGHLRPWAISRLATVEQSLQQGLVTRG
ncbi:MAG: hypothetical protein Q8O25_00815 [Sulfurisoma sp.]|nr:hypothetical protein [Sulfurisoma sp.]